MSFALDSRTWAKQQFKACRLGDQRRTKRLIEVAINGANNPAASFPEQSPTWGDLKAAYRLFAAEDVTFVAVAMPHWRQTQQLSPGRYLVLCDTTELDFGYERDIDGLAPVGNGGGRGFLLHNALVVEPTTSTVVGLAAQTIHYRRPRPKGENVAQRFRRVRESCVWGDVVDMIGAPSPGVELVLVGDRGADDYELFCHLRKHAQQAVIRASSLNRLIERPNEPPVTLAAHLPTLPVAGEYDLTLRARPGQAARTARLEVRFGTVTLPQPKHTTEYVKQHPEAELPMQVVWVRESSSPSGAPPIEWVLYTTLPVATFDEAWQIIAYYEQRWLVEEFHKALKTGCRVEGRLLQDAERLEPMVALMSITAVRLLQLKSVARQAPNRPARELVPPLWLKMLKAVRKKLKSAEQLTIYQFYRELAKLGGFLGRKSDGEPGWITIWRGWEKLNLLVQGAELWRE